MITPNLTTMTDVLDSIENALDWRSVRMAGHLESARAYYGNHGECLAWADDQSVHLQARVDADVLALIQARESVVRGLNQLADDPRV